MLILRQIETSLQKSSGLGCPLHFGWAVSSHRPLRPAILNQPSLSDVGLRSELTLEVNALRQWSELQTTAGVSNRFMSILQTRAGFKHPIALSYSLRRTSNALEKQQKTHGRTTFTSNASNGLAEWVSLVYNAMQGYKKRLGTASYTPH